MPTNVETYVDYFRQHAVKHSLLLHDVQTESGLGKNGDKHFCIFGTEEVLQSLRTEMGDTFIALEMYETNLSSETAYDIRQTPKGAFMVVNAAELNNPLDELRAYIKTEGIVYDILKKTWQDHYGPTADQCTRPFKQFKWNGSLTPTGKVFTNHYGWYVQFDFDFRNTLNITQPPADGAFLT